LAALSYVVDARKVFTLLLLNALYPGLIEDSVLTVTLGNGRALPHYRHKQYEILLGPIGTL